MRSLRALAWTGAAAVLASLGWLDVGFGMFSSHADGLIALGAGLLAVAVALVAPLLGRVALPVSAVPVSAAIVTVSWERPEAAPFGLAATAAMLGVLALIAWRGQWVLAVVVSPLLVAAVVSQPLLRHYNEISVIVSLALALVSMVAAAAGLTARLVGLSRLRREETVRLAQRAEFARDLHDYVAHHVTGILLLAQGARAVAAKEPQLVAPALESIEKAGAEATATMRRMVGLLQKADATGELGPPATVADIERLVDGFHVVSGPKARLDMVGPFDDLPVEIQLTVHRVVMEALTNVRKHADGARQVEVRVCRNGDRVVAKVTDDGRSGHGSGRGLGLRGLADRAAALDGSFTAGPAPAGGWVVEASFPAGRA